MCLSVGLPFSLFWSMCLCVSVFVTIEGKKKECGVFNDMLHVPLKEFIVSFYRLEIAGWPLGRKTALKAQRPAFHYLTGSSLITTTSIV